MTVDQGQGIQEIIDQLLAHVQAGAPPIRLVSIAFQLPAVDPLDVLRAIQDETAPSALTDLIAGEQGIEVPGEPIYWEMQRQQTAITAFGQVAKAELNGAQRFSQAQAFITEYFRHILCMGAMERPLARPRFFCGFTFTDQSSLSADRPINGGNSVDHLDLNLAPFPAARLVLPHWHLVRAQKQSTLVVNLPWHCSPAERTDLETYISKLCQQAWGTYQSILDLDVQTQGSHPWAALAVQGHLLQRSSPGSSVPPQELTLSAAEAEQFCQRVRATLQAIEQQKLQKAVLACVLDVESSAEFCVWASLRKLQNAHPDSCLFALGNGKGQTFLGASPERLLRINNQQLETDALAGTAPRGQTIAEDRQLANTLLASPKERHEHQLVVDFIVQQLQALGLNPRPSAHPDLLQLTHIQHLHTAIQADCLPEIHPLEILAQLHPTPAVAGVPRQAACEHIKRNETFERSLYAAPIGWIDDRDNCEFIVGIRSALLRGGSARLFAGAGIVNGSDPDREVSEVQLKLQALLMGLA